MGQETLSGSYKRVEEMKVSWGVRSCAIGKVGKVERGRAQMCMIKGVWESVGLGPHIHPKGWGPIRGTSVWCVVC